jgi:hypothetical protein
MQQPSMTAANDNTPEVALHPAAAWLLGCDADGIETFRCPPKPRRR